MLRHVVALSVALAFATPAWSQNTGVGGLNNFGIGSTAGGFGNTGFGNSAFGSLSSPTPATGAAAGGTTGLATLGGGSLGGFDASFGAAQLAAGIATAGRTGLGGVGGRLGGGFGGGLGGFGGFGGGRGGFGGGFGNMNSQNQPPAVRAVIRIGFPYTAAPANQTAMGITDRFSRMPLTSKLRGLNIGIEGRTAVLRGTVDSVEEGQLAERLLALEPGVDAVRNELVIGSNGESLDLVPAPAPIVP